MTTQAAPILQAWYKDLESDELFQIVALDEEEDSIEVQYQNGDIGEFDRETWYASAFEAAEAPEDWSAPFDDVEPDDLGYSDPDVHEPRNQEGPDLSELVNE